VNGSVDGVERLNRWSPLIRVVAAALAVVYVASRRDELPAGHEPFAWLVCLLFGIAAVALLVGSRRADELRRPRLDLAAIALDVLAVFSFIFLFAYDAGQPLRSLVFLVVVEAGLRFGLRGGIGVAVASLPLLLAAEVWRVQRFDYSFQPESIIVRMGLVLLIGTVVGQLAAELVGERRRAVGRADEAERLRDELGRRVDLLEAANRCARALGSSLELEQASQAFSRELRGLVPFDRMAIVLAEDERPRVITDTEPDGRLPRTLLASALEGRLAVYEDLARSAEPDERALVGLRGASEILVHREPSLERGREQRARQPAVRLRVGDHSRPLVLGEHDCHAVEGHEPAQLTAERLRGLLELERRPESPCAAVGRLQQVDPPAELISEPFRFVGAPHGPAPFSDELRRELPDHCADQEHEPHAHDDRLGLEAVVETLHPPDLGREEQRQ